MSLLDELIKTSNIDIKKLVGIGLACPGIVTPQSGKVKTASIFRGERNLDLISPFQKRFNVPCCVYNNSSLFAMLEKIRGFGKEMNSFLFMHSISGLSMFLNNLVYEGHQGCGGELGFLQIDPRGPVGADGRKGIIASVRPFNKASRTIQKIIEAGAQNTIMTKYWNREKEPILFFEPVKKAAIEGDILSRYYIKEAFETIAEVVVGLIYLFNPEAFFLPSWTAECEDITIQVVRDKAALCKLMNDELDVKIQAGYTCDELIAEGAALQMLLNFFEVNTYLR
jgi:glucokinase